MKKIILTLLFLMISKTSFAQKCPFGELELSVLDNPNQLRLHGALETPHSDYEYAFKVNDKLKAGVRKHLWAELRLIPDDAAQKPSKFAFKTTTTDVDVTFKRPPFKNMGTAPAIKVKKDFGWGPVFLMGQLPEKPGTSICLMSLNIFEDGRRIDGNGLFPQQGS